MLQVLCMLVIGLTPLVSWAASFNCSKASTPVEKLICGNPRLSSLDEDLAAAFKNAEKKASDPAPLVADQKGWLKDRRNRCRDANCLEKACQERITELARWNDPAPGDKNIFGNYAIKKDNRIYDGKKEEAVKTTDCLTLKKAKGNRIYFSFNLVGANGHMCSLAGEATPSGSFYAYIPDKDVLAVTKECKLRIHVKRNTIAIEDVDDKCREYACGARAVIGTTEFGRKQTVREECQYP